MSAIVVVVSIVIAVLVLGLGVGLALVRLGSLIAPGSRHGIQRGYRRQRADLRRARRAMRS